LRNNLRTQELLQNKIKTFNGEEGVKKWLLKNGMAVHLLGLHRVL
jgi:hypothetical protein